jgi:hypothetical protein
VLKIVSVAALVLVVAAGCGDGSRPERSVLRGVPSALARDWQGQANEIASAASAGEDCRALRLAKSLRNQVLASERELPARLRSPLVTGVNALADRLTCTVTTTVETVPQEPKPPDKHKEDHKDHHGHHGHGDGGGDDK